MNYTFGNQNTTRPIIHSFQISGLEKFMRFGDESAKVVRKLVQRAVNKTCASTRTHVSSIIREKFNIKKHDLDRKISVYGAKRSTEYGVVSIKGEPILVGYFGATQYGRGQKRSLKGYSQVKVNEYKGRRSGVRLTIERGKPSFLRRAWIGTGRGGTQMVFHRQRWNGRWVIVGHKTIMHTSMIEQRSREVGEFVARTLERYASHEFSQGFKFGLKGYDAGLL